MIPPAIRPAVELADRALSEHRGVIAFSGGFDSSVLADLTYRFTPHRPPLLFADSGLEAPETLPHVEAFARALGAELLIARCQEGPEETWQRIGLPLIGKQAGAKWSQSHAQMGFRVNCSGCCKTRKIRPARKLMRSLGFDLQLTGLRGNADSASRGMRAKKDGSYYLQKDDRTWIGNPLTGWTDLKVTAYAKKYGVPLHPAILAGHQSPGCVPCGGGSQFTGSNLRSMRLRYPDLGKHFIPVIGPAVLAIKHDAPLSAIHRAIAALGGLESLMESRPWIFDFTRRVPLEGYNR